MAAVAGVCYWVCLSAYSLGLGLARSSHIAELVCQQGEVGQQAEVVDIATFPMATENEMVLLCTFMRVAMKSEVGIQLTRFNDQYMNNRQAQTNHILKQALPVLYIQLVT